MNTVEGATVEKNTTGELIKADQRVFLDYLIWKKSQNDGRETISMVDFLKKSPDERNQKAEELFKDENFIYKFAQVWSKIQTALKNQRPDSVLDLKSVFLQEVDDTFDVFVKKDVFEKEIEEFQKANLQSV